MHADSKQHFKEPNKAMRMTLRITVSVAVSVILLVLCLRYLDLAKFTERIAEVSPGYFVASFACFFAYQVLRTFRFRMLAQVPAGLPSLFNTLCVHSFLNTNLPAGLGELALAYLLKKFHFVEYNRGLAAISAARVVDLGLFCIIIFAVVSLGLFDAPEELYWVLGGLGLILIFVLAIIFLLHRFLPYLDQSKPTWWVKCLGFVRSYVANLVLLREQHIARPVALFSLGMWFLLYLYFVFTIKALHFDIPIFNILLLYLLIFPMNILPVKGVANLGTHEAAWFIALSLLGMSPGDSATLAFGSHLIFFIVICAIQFFPLSFVVIKFFRKTLKYRLNNNVHTTKEWQ
jgi:uncharacterized membrane protein YbhN (UPF0104 family)